MAKGEGDGDGGVEDGWSRWQRWHNLAGLDAASLRGCCAAQLRSQPRRVAALLGMAAIDWSRDSALVTPAHGPGVVVRVIRD